MGTTIKATILAGLAAIAILAAMPSGASAAFCESGVAYDYAQPLEEMPPLPPAPESRGLPFGQAPRQLSFGPRGIYLGRRGQTQLMLSEGGLGGRVDMVGYALSIPVEGKFANPDLPPIEWLVTTKLARVDGAGRVTKSLGWVSRNVTGPGPNEGVPLKVPFSRDLGYYRLEITFRNGAGERLGRYGEYFRVLPPVSDTRLTLSATTYRPGEAVSGCLENLGTTPFVYGACGMSIETYEYSGWKRAPFDPPRACILVALSLGAGKSTLVRSIEIPADAAAGSYRVEHYGLQAEFQILPPS